MTGAAANRVSIGERAEVDAIAVGSGTVLADDPLLTARGAYRHRPLTRVIFDSRLRTPPDGAALLDARRRAGHNRQHAVSRRPQPPTASRRCVEAGADVQCVAADSGLGAVLEQLAAWGLSSVVVEGGAALHRAFWDAGLVDRVQMYIDAVHARRPPGVEWPLAPASSEAGHGGERNDPRRLAPMC